MAKSGVKVVYNRLPEIARVFPFAVGAVVRETAEEVANTAKMKMAEPKTGRVYVKKNNLGHQASAPGEAPAIDTGALVNSIKVEMVAVTKAEVSASGEQAAPLEFGTADGHIAARPFFRPAARQAAKKFIERLKAIEAKL